MIDSASVVDLSFPVQGSPIPADHAYPLYAAVSRQLAWLHQDDHIGIHPIGGRLLGNRALELTTASRLTLRLPASRVPRAIPLAGRSLDIDGAELRVGIPVTTELRPVATVASRLVVIRGFTDAEAFLEAVARQLRGLQIAGTASLVPRSAAHPREGGAGGRDPYVRRTLRIHEREIVGFAVRVEHLTAEESIRLQEVGIGGRRKFGCGIFIPPRR